MAKIDDVRQLIEMLSRPEQTATALEVLASEHLRAYAALIDQTTWRKIASAPKDGRKLLLRIQLNNGQDPPVATIVGFFAAAGTTEMDTDDDSIVNQDGTNAEDAWFSQSDDREPYAMMLNYEPIAWMPVPPHRDQESE